MGDKKEDYQIKITRRPWWEWVLWGIWLIIEIIFFQGAMASRRELEPRAATLFGLIFFVLLLAGSIIWIIRRNRLI